MFSTIAKTWSLIGGTVIWMCFAAQLAAQVVRRTPEKTWKRYLNVEDAGFSEDKLLSAIRKDNVKDIAGLVVVYDGAILLRHGDIETRYMCHSVRKSLMSILFGMYDIDLNKTLLELEIDDSPPLTADEKKATIGDLIKSKSGVYHRAAYEPSSMKRSRPRRGSHKAGTHWWYNNWDFNTLLTIFEKETGEKFFAAFKKRIAEPLQLQDFRLRDGYYHREPVSQHPAYPFRLSARDMARVGWLVAAGGRWGDRQVVPSKWINESTLPHTKIPPWNGYRAYGYLWWIANYKNDRVISALGNGNNAIDIVPARKLVFVFRANTFKGKSIGNQDRWKIIQGVINAQDRAPKPAPELAELVRHRSMPAEFKRIHLGDDELDIFPVDLPRLLPANLPAKIRNKKVRIDVAPSRPKQPAGHPEIVLYTQIPPAMQLDLIPIAKDRFWIEGLNEVGVVLRDDERQPIAFAMKNDLVASAKAAKLKSDEAEAKRLAELLAKHFDHVMPTGPK